MRFAVISVVVLVACAGRSRVAMPPPATADQSLRDAVVLVCDTPARAKPDAEGEVTMSDAIAGHLTDGIGNDRVLTIVEGWKTTGIAAKELDALTTEANVSSCALRATIGAR